MLKLLCWTLYVLLINNLLCVRRLNLKVLWKNLHRNIRNHLKSLHRRVPQLLQEEVHGRVPQRVRWVIINKMCLRWHALWSYCCRAVDTAIVHSPVTNVGKSKTSRLTNWSAYLSLLWTPKILLCWGISSLFVCSNRRFKRRQVTKIHNRRILNIRIALIPCLLYRWALL